MGPIMRASGPRRWVGEFVRDRKGGPMIEAIIAVMVLGVVGTVVLSGLSVTRTAVAKIEERATTENIARNHLEYVFSLPYQAPPSTYVSTNVSGYDVTVEAMESVPGDPDIEELVVTLTRSGQPVLVKTTLRARE